MTLDTVLVVVGICTPFILLTLWGIIHAAQRDFGAIEKKAAWILVAAIPFLGFIIYIFFGLKRGKKPGDMDGTAK